MASIAKPGYSRLVEQTRAALLDSGLPFEGEQVKQRQGRGDLVSWPTVFVRDGREFLGRVSVLGGGVTIEIVREAPVPPDRVQAVSELCAGLNRDSPFASLYVSWRYKQRVVSAHRAPSADGLNLDWIYIKNLVDLAVGGATRFAGYVDAVVAGQSSRAALDSFPGERWPEPTATDEWHLEMFLQSVQAQGLSEFKRTSPNSAVLPVPTPSGGRTVFVDALLDQVWISAYVFDGDDAVPPSSARHPAVAELLNLISAEGVPGCLALDYRTGQIRARMNLPLGGTKVEDPGAVILAGAGETATTASIYGPLIRRVATTGVAPAEALASHERWLSGMLPD